MMDKKLIHISDLHFGEYKFDEKLKNNLKFQIEYENPDLIVVAGDITALGYLEDYNLAREFLYELNNIAETSLYREIMIHATWVWYTSENS